MSHLGSDAEQDKSKDEFRDEFAEIVKIVLATFAENNTPLDSYAKKNLRATCKATRAVLHPYIKSVAVPIQEFVSVCQGNGVLPWDPSHVESVRVRSLEGTNLETWEAFTKLPMPKLKSLDVCHITHPMLLANGDWPKLESLRLIIARNPSHSTENDEESIIKKTRTPNWPLESLVLEFVNYHRLPRINFSHGVDMSDILAVFPSPKTLNLEMRPKDYNSSVIPSLAAASLPFVENLQIFGNVPDMLTQIAAAQNWPSIRHLSIHDTGFEAFDDLSLDSCLCIKRLETLTIAGEFVFDEDQVEELIKGLHGGSLRELKLDTHSKDFSEFLPIRNGYLPHLTELHFQCENPGWKEEWEQLANTSINGVLDAIFAARCPLLEILIIGLPSLPVYDEIESYFLWTECPSIQARVAFPKLEHLQLEHCSISSDVVTYLNELRAVGCTLELNCVIAPKISQLTPGLESLMKDLQMSIDELDDALRRDGGRPWLDFWVWGMDEDEKTKTIVQRYLSDHKKCVIRDGKVDLSRLKKVVAVLEGADEGSSLANLAVENAEWIIEAKITIESLEKLRNIN